MPNNGKREELKAFLEAMYNRHFVIFEDATNRCSWGQKYPSDKYPKRIQLRNESRSCLGMSLTTRPMHARITCICLIKCLLLKNQCNLNKSIYCFHCFLCYFIACRTTLENRIQETSRLIVAAGYFGISQHQHPVHEEQWIQRYFLYQNV